jgi:tRNA nucleotidyltransferase (CCA-adding enzyme)
LKRPAPGRILDALPRAARPLVERVQAEAEARDVALHLVGGPVRDFLLGRALRDVDLLVEPQPGLGAAELVRAALPSGSRIQVHERFGTVRVESGDAVVDLATARAERYAAPGALPEVGNGSLEDDLRRRDFTVNAIAVPLTRAARSGRPPLIAPGTGLADLEAGVLRVFHPRSFHDDPTRALRAARLGPRLGFRLARSAGAALRAALRDGAFAAVSGERFRAELDKLFRDAPLGLDPVRALRLLSDWHVLGALEPGLTLPAEAGPPLRRLGRALAEPPWAEPPAHPLPCGLALWLAPLEPSLRRGTLRRLAVRGAAARSVSEFPARRDLLLRALARARGRGASDAVLAPLDGDTLLAVYASAAPPLRRRILRFAREDRGAIPPVTGEDLVALGLRGPAVGAALARLRAAFLDREVRERDELLALASELAKRGRLPHTDAAPPRKPRSSPKSSSKRGP